MVDRCHRVGSKYNDWVLEYTKTLEYTFMDFPQI